MFRLVSIFFILISFNSEACCSAGQLRIFPLGMIKEKPLCTVFETSRVCSDDGMGPDNVISWFVILSLQFLENDSLRLFKSLDTVEFIECVCDYDEIESKSEYLLYMQKYLDKAYKLASKEIGFVPFVGSLYAADSLSIKAQFAYISDSVAIWKKHEIDFRKNESISCLEMNELKELRIYKTSKFELLIAAVSCPTHRYISHENLLKNKEYFQKKGNSMTYIPVDWHGYSIDIYQLIERKDQK